ncbi:MAG: ATP-dependent helicase [Candidatus Aminicenantes bacterium]|nr:ATP-dependent helicase [Candidatus Aminicenantes bacterium]
MNEEQRKAVTHGRGPLLVIAGAGTGKTKVITHRIAYLIATKKARPEEILAVTFTEKAAGEMEERVDLLVPYGYSFVEISTFNSFGERILRDYGLELGYGPDFRLLDDVEQAIFFRRHLFQFPMKYFRPLSAPTKYIQEILSAVKRLKQEGVKPGDYISYAEKHMKEAVDAADEENAAKEMEIARVYDTYQQLLQSEGKIDFEDQVMLVVDLFRRHPSVLKKIKERYKYILVDEFQDTNTIQFILLKLLVEDHRNLNVVGDDDQSIFRFRGASLSNILHFMDEYPETKTIVLTQNYRSTQAILDCAYRLIRLNDPDRLEHRLREEWGIQKRLRASFPFEGKSIHLLGFDTDSHEADAVADKIEKIVGEGLSYGDVAVLVRRNTDADPFLRAMNMREIPFRFSGSRGLYLQEEVRILTAFIRTLFDFDDSRSLFFLARSEVYGMDIYDLMKISRFAAKKNFSLHVVFKKIFKGERSVAISEKSQKIVKRIFEDLLSFLKTAGSENAGRVLYAFLEKSGYLKKLVQEKSIQAELKIKNIRIFFDKVKNFSGLTDDDSIIAFARHLDLLQQVGDNPASAEAELDEDAVNVLTVHKAKGLEFTAVFLVCLVRDRFPGRELREKISIPGAILKETFPAPENYLQEERRLFYVGMTRAKKYLYLTWARDYGQKRIKKISPFVLEALNLSRVPEKVHRISALEEIQRYIPSIKPPREFAVAEKKKEISLSYFQVQDYLICPLKYRFRHVMRIPDVPHHNLVFGRVMHGVIHYFLKNRMLGKEITREELIEEYDKRWINEGFLSREHEELRRDAGRRALERFYEREKSEDRLPFFIEKSFNWTFDGIRFSGRWDRVDLTKDGAVIIDFKAAEAGDQKEADKRTRESLQLDLYALSFVKTRKEKLLETQLYFLESDIVGHAGKAEKEMSAALEKIRKAAVGIQNQNFLAEPNWHSCSNCEFKNVCTESYAY